ncbi:MAG: hypothetical protein RL194_459 [Pseudomonadota bacterium]|jgi:two-component system nitrate/nitrite response regulator NarL
MQNLFITSGDMLANWKEAFATGKAFNAITPAVIDALRQTDAVLWLHEESGRQAQVLEVIARILQSVPGAKLVVLSNIPEQQQAMQVLNAGALGYCHAHSAAEALTEVRAVVIHGGLWLGRDLLQRLIRATVALAGNSSGQVESALSKLTQRERDVALEAAKGHSNKEIARQLDITERTVKAHISACFERLGVKDRLQLALMLNEKTNLKL